MKVYPAYRNIEIKEIATGKKGIVVPYHGRKHYTEPHVSVFYGNADET